jgi:hypothetical protein
VNGKKATGAGDAGSPQVSISAEGSPANSQITAPAQEPHERQSGYDPETGICWQFRNKGDLRWRCKCPACSHRGERTLVLFGRCHSGQRWFWLAQTFGEKKVSGFTNTELEAMDAAMAAVRGFRAGVPLLASVSHSQASYELKELNKAKRLARPAPDTSDTRVVEYLYSGSRRFQILKKTKQRIYYSSQPLVLEDENSRYNTRDLTDYRVKFINRQKIERDGEIWSHRSSGWWEADARLYLAPPTPQAEPAPPDLRELKAAMAAAHPDRGGSHEAFIAARRAYVEARRKSARRAAP